MSAKSIIAIVRSSSSFDIYKRKVHHSDSPQELQLCLALLRTIAMMDFALIDVIQHGPKRIPDSPDTEKRRKSDPR